MHLSFVDNCIRKVLNILFNISSLNLEFFNPNLIFHSILKPIKSAHSDKQDNRSCFLTDILQKLLHCATFPVMPYKVWKVKQCRHDQQRWCYPLIISLINTFFDVTFGPDSIADDIFSDRSYQVLSDDVAP